MTGPDPTLPTSTTPPAIMDLDVLKAEIEAQLPSVETAEEAPVNQGLQWLKLMGLAIGDDVVIIPMAPVMQGQQIGGKLVEAVFSNTSPVVFLIRQTDDKPINSIPWHGIQLIAKALAPAVEVAQPAVDLTELENFMRENGLDIPDDVQEFLDGEKP